jgi:hypothetical protein
MNTETVTGIQLLREAFEAPESFFKQREIPVLTAKDVQGLRQSMPVNFGTDTEPQIVETNFGASLKLDQRNKIVLPVVFIGTAGLMYVDSRREELKALGIDLGRLAIGLMPEVVGIFTSKKSTDVCNLAIRQLEAESGQTLPKVVFINSKNRGEIEAQAEGGPVVAYKPITAKPGEVKHLTTNAGGREALEDNDRLEIIDDVDSRGASRMAARIYRAIVRGMQVPQEILDNLEKGIVLSETAMQAIEAGIDPVGQKEEELQKKIIIKRRANLLKQLLDRSGDELPDSVINELVKLRQSICGAVVQQATMLKVNNEDLGQLALTAAEIEMSIPEVREVCLAQEYVLLGNGEAPDLPKGMKVLFRIPVIDNF